jgi:hypothetical protein
MRKITWFIFIFFAVAIGLYPFTYVALDMGGGLLSSKPPELLKNQLWHFAFFVHILLGGLSLLAGFSQFSKRLRSKRLTLHRNLGKLYLVCVLFSGSAGLYIAFYASGGLIPVFGFSCLAVAWLYTSLQAYRSILRRDVDRHEYFMIRSYALCWAAVTLRIWLPLFQFALGMDFFFAYQIIAWLCWVPNLLVAELIVHNMKVKRLTTA